MLFWVLNTPACDPLFPLWARSYPLFWSLRTNWGNPAPSYPPSWAPKLSCYFTNSSRFLTHEQTEFSMDSEQDALGLKKPSKSMLSAIPTKNPAHIGKQSHPLMKVNKANHMNGQKICLIWTGKQHKFWGWFGFLKASAVITQKYIGQMPQLTDHHAYGLTNENKKASTKNTNWIITWIIVKNIANHAVPISFSIAPAHIAKNKIIKTPNMLLGA